jgi:hypothetical protein
MLTIDDINILLDAMKEWETSAPNPVSTTAILGLLMGAISTEDATRHLIGDGFDSFLENMERPYDADTCRERILEFTKIQNPLEILPGWKGRLLGNINAVLASDQKGTGDEKRHIVFGWLFGDPDKRLVPLSSKHLTEPQWFALWKWVGIHENTEGKWVPGEYFMTEALFVLNAALRKVYQDEGQMLMELEYDKA